MHHSNSDLDRLSLSRLDANYSEIKKYRPKSVFRLCSNGGGGHVHLLFSESTAYSMERIIKDGTNVASNFLGVCVRIKFLV